jgi:oxepin-CoA hydrolase/3-oxo-5,6-dehydrosuberyl-CoA semialdehyde dehydrogenase
MRNVTTLQSLIGGRWLGAEASVPLHSALNNALIYHTHAEKIDFDEAVTYARKTGVPALMALDFQKRAACLKALALYLMERKEELYAVSHLSGRVAPGQLGGHRRRHRHPVRVCQHGQPRTAILERAARRPGHDAG